MKDEEFLKWIGRSCVAVVWQDKLKEEAKPSGGMAFSTFIMSISGTVVLATAGHIVQVIQSRQKAGRALVGARIYDSWSRKPITKDGVHFFDIGDCEQGYAYDDDLGVDYAWFKLRSNHIDLLRNNDMAPLNEAAWMIPKPEPEWVGFNCFGFPEDKVGGFNVELHDKAGNFCGLKLKPRLIPYVQAKPHPDLLKTKHPRLFFLPGGASDGRVPELQGMSGGPVLGYAKQGTDLRYWLVGIQSGQADNAPRVASVCPADRLAESIKIKLGL